MSNNKYCIGPGYGDGIYLIRKLKIQDEILAFLEQIPVATGVGVAKDITDIEFFYSTVSGRDPEIKGSIDLTPSLLRKPILTKRFSFAKN